MQLSREFLNDSRNLIFNNEMETVLKKLFAHKEIKNEYHDEVIMMNSNWKENNKLERLGVLAYNELNINRNRIRLSVLQLIRELEASQDLFRETEFDVKTEKNIIIPEKKNIKGFWRMTNGNGKVYFDQRENKIVGIYDIAGIKRVGYYSGLIRDNDVFEFKWKWFNDEAMFGYGQFLIMFEEMLGKYWIDKNTDDLGEIRYSFVREEKPKWVDDGVMERLWNLG